jgi:hypothetical protein
MTFFQIIVGLIVIFYGICMYQLMRIWMCQSMRKWWKRKRRQQNGLPDLDDEENPQGPPSNETSDIATTTQQQPNDDTVLVHEGRVFTLSDDQRRAVLEAIFSTSSKASTFILFFVETEKQLFGLNMQS